MELGVHCDIFDMAGTPFLVHSGVQGKWKLYTLCGE